MPRSRWRFCNYCPANYLGNGQCDAAAGECQRSIHDPRAEEFLQRRLERRQRDMELSAQRNAEMAEGGPRGRRPAGGASTPAAEMAEGGPHGPRPAAGASTPAAEIAGGGPPGRRPAPAAAVDARSGPPHSDWETGSGDPVYGLERLHRLLLGPVRETLEEMPGGTLVTDAEAAGIVLELVRRCMAAGGSHAPRPLGRPDNESAEGAAGGSHAPAPQ